MIFDREHHIRKLQDHGKRENEAWDSSFFTYARVEYHNIMAQYHGLILKIIYRYTPKKLRGAGC
jgi:hypothetical protein